MSKKESKKIEPAPREQFLMDFLYLTDKACIHYKINYEVPFNFWAELFDCVRYGTAYNENTHKEIWKDILSRSQTICDLIIYDKTLPKNDGARKYLNMPGEVNKLLKLS